MPKTYPMREIVKFKKLSDKAKLPAYAHSGDSGFDLCSAIDIEIPAKSSFVVPTDLSVELPKNTELQIRSRSGLAAKSNVFVLNSPGTVDCEYRGPIGIIVYNLSDVPFKISVGDRIAQGVVQKVFQYYIQEVETLTDTERGQNGFGSTGTK